ncbi:MAG TPA: hypothetical protein VF384_02895, partial [Planctomycetota bacterium]
MPPILVVGGEFTIAGTVAANAIAAYDPLTGVWSALGSGMTNGSVGALATLPNGDLVAGGLFTTAGGVSANNIARWNGTSWSALGSGMNNAVYACTALPNGDLVAAGSFTTAGGVSVNRIARWNGTSWTALGSGLSLPPFGGTVSALAVLANGDLVAGGSFTIAGGVSANSIARWDGTSWTALGSGMSLPPPYSAVVHVLVVLANGDLVAAGGFTTAGGVSANNIARWNGTSWSALGSGMTNGSVGALATLPNGDLAAGGPFTTAGGVSANYTARWNGTSWSALGSGMNSDVRTLTTLPNGDLVAGGLFRTAGVVGADRIARWNGTSWSALSSGMNGSVGALTSLPNGDLVVGGGFTVAEGVSANCMARWDGTNWSALGSGISGPASRFVHAMAVLPNGDVVAGGEFTTAGGVSANNIAYWNGTSWSALGSGMNSDVRTLTT